MKFSVGYSVSSSNAFLEEIVKNKERIKEVYFSWGDFPNGRSPETVGRGLTEWEAYEKATNDLSLLNAEGIEFNLLFNGNCYGGESLSEGFYNKIGDTADFIKTKFNLSSVTTTSPLIARFIKDNFPDLKTRASVNMGIGSSRGMAYLSEYFDGFYLKRELNRDLNAVKFLSGICRENGKELFLLANSGCLSDCSAHTFHDNLVAHEEEISEKENCYSFEGICHEFLKKQENRISLLRDTNFIRPEELSYYEPYFGSVKLATRASDMALMILRSYLAGHHPGNVLELLEPNHAGRIFPYVIDNGRLSECRVLCDKNCSSCNKCEEEFDSAYIKL